MPATNITMLRKDIWLNSFNLISEYFSEDNDICSSEGNCDKKQFCRFHSCLLLQTSEGWNLCAISYIAKRRYNPFSLTAIVTYVLLKTAHLLFVFNRKQSAPLHTLSGKMTSVIRWKIARSLSHINDHADGDGQETVAAPLRYREQHETMDTNKGQSPVCIWVCVRVYTQRVSSQPS